VLKAAELFDEGIAVAERVQTWARDRGSPIWFAIAAMWRGRFLQARGDLRDAEADARAAAAAVDSSVGWLAYIPSAALTEILLDRGDVAGARAAWETMGLGEAIPPGRPMTVLVFTRGVLRLAEGDTAAALRDLEAADRRLLDIAPPSMNGQDGRLARAMAYHANGDRDRAHAIADEALQIARSWGTPGAIGEALRISGLVMDDRERLTSAVTALASSPIRVSHARALLDLGAALRRANRRADAREPLREALRRARATSADGVERAAAAELEATGAHVPPRAGSGAAALTPSEARVARMAADGLSNKEIAQALFVTAKTIEMHLGNAYRKLDVTSRRDLPRALGQPD
jgi:DNA-binding CsgD family transcriptional regulator